MRRNPVLCFLGPDGSGKSTLAKKICNNYSLKGKKVEYVWWIEGENGFIKRILRNIGGNNLRNLESNRSNQKKYQKYIQNLYFNLTILNYLIFTLKKVIIPRISKEYDLIILDRYIYDIFIYLSNEFNYDEIKKSIILKRILTMTPFPNMIFFIEVETNLLYARRKEDYTSLSHVKYIKLQYENLYDALYNNKGIVKKIDNMRPIEIVLTEIIDWIDDSLDGLNG